MNEFILYVADQGRAREFYQQVLEADPVLDVPGGVVRHVDPS